ncbi:MAG: HAD hydrolase family protein [Rhodanobacter sp.]|jgi:Cu2+-exporting ATPase
MRASGHVVLAVGDGSNDAPLLAAADVSAALASGTNLAQAQADLLLLDGHLAGLTRAHAIAHQLQAVMGQSRRWALLYNLVAVPFAAFGLVPPWLAAIGMSLSSLVVVLNAMRVGGTTSADQYPAPSACIASAAPAREYPAGIDPGDPAGDPDRSSAA